MSCMPHRCDELAQLRVIQNCGDASTQLHWPPQLLCVILPRLLAHTLTLMSNYFHFNQSPCTGPRPRPRIVCCRKLGQLELGQPVPVVALVASLPPHPIRPIVGPRRGEPHCTMATARPSGVPRIPMWPINFAITRSKRPCRQGRPQWLEERGGPPPAGWTVSMFRLKEMTSRRVVRS